MADWTTASGIGRRLRAIRRHRGFTTTRSLADAIPDGRISESVLQNIEAGRKDDLSVSQLLNISHALSVSPLFLLVPLGRPHEHVDLPNLSSAVGRMTVAGFDAWVSGLLREPYRSADAYFELLQLSYAREIESLGRERWRLGLMDTRAPEPETSDERRELLEQFESTDRKMAELTKRIDELEDILIRQGWFESDH